MSASGNIGRSPPNRGFVIVAVLWILLALSSLAIIFSAYLAASASALAASALSLQTRPYWLRIATQYHNIKEIKGPRHNGVILKWLDQLGAWWRDDETPWCGVFVAAVMKEAGIDYPKMYMRAKDWLKWGYRIKSPVYGAVVILDRKGGGHVGFAVGITEDGKQLAIYGGNQRDQINVMMVDISRVLGYRLPIHYAYYTSLALPIATADEFEQSFNEA